MLAAGSGGMGVSVGVFVAVGVRVGVGVLLGKMGVSVGIKVAFKGALLLKFKLGSAVVSAAGVKVGGILLPKAATSTFAGGSWAGAARVGKMIVLLQAETLSNMSKNNTLLAVWMIVCCMEVILAGCLPYVNGGRRDALCKRVAPIWRGRNNQRKLL